ncbi:RHS repeat-associated core domain-containing protein [Xylophilus ampelinus]|uniref:RHS repeat-associated protein n=1 Tax=Xylophilus ampelinus TaxID=54067 RepID=A0A318SGG1_9BURK|nr:RHS repeat-associated core domain-containing protein [Xylophilus ampelinus]MCS4510458.1 hypothetical protein [Xylophilus ampelinus]PYE77913.1 RHS repeat-associated protein [Xylophilus ampelinus]
MTYSFDGSQALNRISSAIEDVIPNSGSLLLNIPIADLVGVTEDIGLKINLSYSLGGGGTLGLPTNWSFGIPSIASGSAIGIKGSRYIVDPFWTDATGYASGLKYVNNHGVKFVDNIVSQPLPHGQYGVEYQFTYSDTDGSVCYFDSTGALLMKANRYGSYVYYAYTPEPQGNLLAYIIDSFGQKTTFTYELGQIVVTLPNGLPVTINTDAGHVYSVVDLIGDATIFNYTTQNDFSVISTVTYPSGKTTNVVYTTIGFLDQSGNSYAIPAVSDLYLLDPKNALLAHYQYTYGTQSGGNTFTGFTGGYSLSSSSDGLLDSNNTAYVYDVEVRTLDQAGTIRSLTNIFYSFAHVPIMQNTYVIDDEGVQLGYQQTNSLYNIAADAYNQQPNYLSPKQTQQLFFALHSTLGVPQTQITYEYDDFGNTTSKQTSAWSDSSQAYVMNLVETASYFTQDSPITTLVDSATKTDATNQGIRTVNTLTLDSKSIATSTVNYSHDGGTTWNGWKTRSQSYDSSGREVSVTIKWAAADVPGVQQTSSAFVYAYDAANFTVGTTITDALGFASLHAISTLYGQKVLEITSSGSTTTYAYDQLGRLVTKTSPSGRQTTHAYKTFVSDGENSAIVIDPLGYQIKTVTDPLGRTIATYDNVNPNDSTPLRLLTQKQYDVLGNVVTHIDKFGNATTSAFNSLGKPTRSVDPLSNKTTLAYDFASNSTITSINGIAQTKVVTDSFGRAVMEERYPNTMSSDKTAQYTMSRASGYDGFNNLTWKTTSQVTAGVATVLHTKSYAYDPESQRISANFSAPNGTTRLKQSVYDLNRKKVSQTKTVTYPDGRVYTVTGDSRQFDALGQMTLLTNNAGQSESFRYDCDQHLVSKTLFDGSVIEYTYKADGYKASESWLENGVAKTTAYTYDAAGRLLETSNASGSVANTYSIDGVLTSITYPDGKKLSYILDGYSRAISQQDFGGATTTYTYTPQNQILSVSTANDVLTHLYCADPAVNLMLGAPLGVILADNYTETYRYDAQGRKNGLQRVSTKDVTLLSELGVFNALDKLISNASSSQITTATTVNHQRTISYDAFGQVTSDTLTGNSSQTISAQTFQYDGNGNVLQSTGPAAGHSTSYTYNNIDQLISFASNSGQPSTQEFDTNGRLVVDGAGNHYTYDVPGQLLGVEDAVGATSYTYYPNELLATRTSEASTVGMYYDNLQQAINTTQGDAMTHFLMVGSKRFASYCGDASPFYYGTNRRQDTVLGCSTELDGGETLIGGTSYSAYGLQADSSVGMDASNNFGWNQEYKDIDNNLVYLRARFYDPVTMRFISRDSKSVDNRYAYCSGDPVNNVDPSGHDDVAVGVGAGVGAVAAVALTYAAITYGPAIVAFITGATAVASAAVGGGAVAAGILGGVAATAAAAAITASAPVLAVAAAGTTAIATVSAVAAGGGALTASAIGAVVGSGLGAYVGGTMGALAGGAVGGMVGTGVTVAAPVVTAAASTAVGYVGTALASVAGAVVETATAATATATATVSAATSMAAEAVAGAAAAVGIESAADAALVLVGAVLLALL